MISIFLIACCPVFEIFKLEWFKKCRIFPKNLLFLFVEFESLNALQRLRFDLPQSLNFN